MSAPDWTENPFSNAKKEEAEDPFADPSITAATTMPEFNPFEGDTSARIPAAAPTQQPPADTAPAWAAPAKQEPAAVEEVAPQWAQNSAEKPPKKKKQSKMTKEEQRRMEQYAEHTEESEDPRLKDPNYRPNNWPPFPEGCPNYWCCKPCFHHDFVGEIPEWGYRVTKRVYQCWVMYFVCLFWNMICMMAALDCKDCDKPVLSVVLSILYFFVFGPLSYLCWFQPLYQAMRKDSSLRFAWFFLSFAFQFMVAVYFSIGMPGSGASGIWVSSVASKDEASAIVAILMFTAAGLWIIYALIAGVMINRVLLVYRSSGQSLDKAGQEAIVGAAKSQAGKKAMKAAVKESLK
eukprot:m.10761 g.10761  ORF g.10761 m.10761 type:complete len:348 (+) comp4315_c0_seq1:1278-2321(+)